MIQRRTQQTADRVCAEIGTLCNSNLQQGPSSCCRFCCFCTLWKVKKGLTLMQFKISISNRRAVNRSTNDIFCLSMEQSKFQIPGSLSCLSVGEMTTNRRHLDRYRMFSAPAGACVLRVDVAYDTATIHDALLRSFDGTKRYEEKQGYPELMMNLTVIMMLLSISA